MPGKGGGGGILAKTYLIWVQIEVCTAWSQQSVDLILWRQSRIPLFYCFYLEQNSFKC